MAIRIKSTWHHSGRNEAQVRELSEHASAYAFIAWKLACDSINNMENERFEINTPPKTIEVAVEFLAFSLSLADRYAASRLSDDEREVFVQSLGEHITKTIIDNLTDIFGPNDYSESVNKLLNDRLDGYSEFKFVDDEPSYPYLGYFGKMVQDVMLADKSRWVKEHVMEIEAPAVTKGLRKSIINLFGSAKPK